MDEKPPPPEAPIEPFAPRGLGYLAAGFVAYVLGFVLLAHNQPDLAPAVIVGGIVAMFWAFVH